MTDALENTIEILERLVSFDSISGRPTHDIVDYIRDYLSTFGIETTLSFDERGERANIFATIGPELDGGIVLNGHTDVVPVVGQEWTTDPFQLTRMGEQLYGRGSVDMKGFLACVLGSVPNFQRANLKKPIHIAFSYDEEIGGIGMPVLLKDMAGKSFRPDIVIVGEPTEMRIITGHKGGFEMRTEIQGHQIHSCNPVNGVNAISVAVKLIAKIEEVGARLAARPYLNSPYNPPFATVNVGTIEGGAARNATAGWCNFDWELRQMPGEDGTKIIAEIEDYARNELERDMREVNLETGIKIITQAPVPPLDDKNAMRAATFIRNLTGINGQGVVSFGTDAGYFSDAGFSTVVFGPGDIGRAHKADEYILASELVQGLGFLDKISQHLSN